ncbi:MAG: methyltransferase [Odoribacter sp.]|nr:methyltransferase [Odoribacter sp.]
MFRFKQFTIRQDHTPMKVGTDGVLLGAWAACEEAGNILDIGTGTGLIALMAAQRNPRAQIHALEIDPGAVAQAGDNIAASPWAERIRLHPLPLQEYAPGCRFDCIICNPPFFAGSTLPPETGRSIARHTDSLPHGELVTHAARLLADEGNLCVILPPAEAVRFAELAATQGLHPRRVTHVLPNPGKAPKRHLVELTTRRQACSESELIVEYSRHHYSPEYIKLTRNFYLNL